MGRHDRSYRQLFSHPGMVASLLRDLLGERRTGPLDLSSLERVNESWVSASHAARYGDQLWRLRRPGGGEVYLLLEFQSNVQRFMAFRVLTYVALLYEDLIARKRWSSAGRIPEVIPVVVYNGNRRWSAPLAVEELIEPGAGSRRHLPQLSYLLVDGGRYPAERLAQAKGPIEALFLLERQRSPAQLDQGVRLLVDQLRGPEDAELRRAFLVWIQRVLLPDRGLTEDDIPALPDLQEFKAMLEQRVRQWNRQLIAQGRKEGRKEALAELLLRHLNLKFGPVDEKVRARVNAASPARLMTWAERILTAETLPDVFRR
jgi:Putative transposase, YhgA-like